VTTGPRCLVIGLQGLRPAVLLSTTVAGLLLTLAAGRPAMSHPATEFAPTNYQTRITAITPAIPGLTMRVLDYGDQLELTNTTGRDLVVRGYEGEPYLRVGPRGAFTNRRSPATYLNRDRFPTSQLPALANPRAAPVWQRSGLGNAVAWHDHRAHWMGSSDPPAVQAAPWQVQVINPQWRVELRDGERPIMVAGDLRWIPTPQPPSNPTPANWPWLAGGGACLLSVVAGVRRWRGRQARPHPGSSPTNARQLLSLPAPGQAIGNQACLNATAAVGHRGPVANPG
jgi:hypothetical protein